MPRLILPIAVLTGITTYTYVRITDLITRYPLPPASHPADAGDTLVAILPRSSSSSPTSPRATLADYTAAFYSTWTLRLEGLGARIAGHVPDPTRESFAGGIFVVQSRTPEKVVVRWNMPEGVQRMMERRGVRPIKGGEQILGCREVEGGVGTEIRYECREELGGKEGDKMAEAATLFHRIYMRFLFDSARAKMEGQWK